MGCFDSTCAMTRLPIHSGDEIVYVEYKNIWRSGERSEEISTYDFLQYTIPAHKLSDYEVDSVRRMEERYASRFPDHADKLEEVIAEIIADKEKYARNKIVIVHGEYNDYGGIGQSWKEGEVVYPPDDIRLKNLYFFVHKAVWEAYAGENDYETLLNLNRAAMNARIELFCGNHPLGQQYSGPEFVTERRKINDIVDALLPTLYCSDEDYYEEEEESES